MKRFHCTECGRVKRVRALPKNVKPNQEKHAPGAALAGRCDRHGAAAK